MTLVKLYDVVDVDLFARICKAVDEYACNMSMYDEGKRVVIECGECQEFEIKTEEAEK